jgi:hypothetical protein
MLLAVPLALMLISPFLDTQPILVQLLGLRPVVLFLPLILFGPLLTKEDWTRFALWSAFVALGSAGVMFAEYVFGIERFFPPNDASKIIYISQDIGEARQYRLPATFSSAHAYGGTIVALIPLLVILIEAGGQKRRLGMAAMAAAGLGVFACGARSPVITLGVVVLSIGTQALNRPALRAAVLMVGVLVGFVVYREARFQRFETLSDYDFVETRVAGSVNQGLLDILLEYPFGHGLGSAAGTSIPYFLAAEAKPQIGMENEYARIAVEQGLAGVVLWMSFAGWILLKSPSRMQKLGGATDVGMWGFCVFVWLQGFIGTGFLASVPLTMLLMLYMGFLSGTSELLPERASKGIPALGFVSPLGG